jgi:hypothetical protein
MEEWEKSGKGTTGPLTADYETKGDWVWGKAMKLRVV